MFKMRYFIVASLAVKRASRASTVKKTKTTTPAMKRTVGRWCPACARSYMKIPQSYAGWKLAVRQRRIKVESAKGLLQRQTEDGFVSLPQLYAVMQFALVAVNTVCALSFIKPMRRVFNLKLLPELTKSTPSSRQRIHRNWITCSRNKINLTRVKQGRNTRGYRSWLRSPLVAGGLIN